MRSARRPVEARVWGARLAGGESSGEGCGPSHGRLTAWRGAVGEELAARALLRDGFQVLARRLVTDTAEVDLVARCPRGTLVVVEVKTAIIGHEGQPRYRPGGHLGPSQLRRLERAARQLARRARQGTRREPGRSTLEARPSGAGPQAWRLELVEVIVTPSGFRVERRAAARAPAPDRCF